MNLDINVAAGLVAGLAAMVPGSIIYMPSSPTGKVWMKEMGKQSQKSGFSPLQAMSMMLFASLVSGLVASVFVSSTGAETVIDALDISLLLAWFTVSVYLAEVFFEGKNRAVAGIGILNQVVTFAVIGVVLGLFL
jgi:hypothetical protein